MSSSSRSYIIASWSSIEIRIMTVILHVWSKIMNKFSCFIIFKKVWNITILIVTTWFARHHWRLYYICRWISSVNLSFCGSMCFKNQITRTSLSSYNRILSSSTTTTRVAITTSYPFWSCYKFPMAILFWSSLIILCSNTLLTYDASSLKNGFWVIIFRSYINYISMSLYNFSFRRSWELLN